MTINVCCINEICFFPAFGAMFCEYSEYCSSTPPTSPRPRPPRHLGTFHLLFLNIMILFIYFLIFCILSSLLYSREFAYSDARHLIQRACCNALWDYLVFEGLNAIPQWNLVKTGILKGNIMLLPTFRKSICIESTLVTS